MNNLAHHISFPHPMIQHTFSFQILFQYPLADYNWILPSLSLGQSIPEPNPRQHKTNSPCVSSILLSFIVILPSLVPNPSAKLHSSPIWAYIFFCPQSSLRICPYPESYSAKCNLPIILFTSFLTLPHKWMLALCHCQFFSVKISFFQISRRAFILLPSIPSFPNCITILWLKSIA